MSCDALFQLGMGPARLEAPQTEDSFAMHGRKRRVPAFRGLFSRVRLRLAALPPVDLRHFARRWGRGNRAKTRLPLRPCTALAS